MRDFILNPRRQNHVVGWQDLHFFTLFLVNLVRLAILGQSNIWVVRIVGIVGQGS